jgi:23S rRNA pseudouridine2605 synthase
MTRSRKREISRSGKAAGLRRPKPKPQSQLSEEVKQMVTSDSTTETQKLQKVLAQAGIGSRRKMEQFIEQGLIKVNGQVATLGMRVSSSDRVEFGRRRVDVSGTQATRVILYHKPEGEIVSRDDPKERQTVFANLPKPKNAKWIAIGRLDFNTSGLLIFTTSGELANRMMHPSFDTEREYSARIFGELTNDQIMLLSSGVELSDGFGKFEACEAIGGEGRNRWYRVIVKEGRNRLVRRMFESLGYQVSRLIRIRFGSIALPPRLTRGKWSELKDSEVHQLEVQCGVVSEEEASTAEHAQRRSPQRAKNNKSLNDEGLGQAKKSKRGSPRGVKKINSTSDASARQRSKPKQRSSRVAKSTKSRPT